MLLDGSGLSANSYMELATSFAFSQMLCRTLDLDSKWTFKFLVGNNNLGGRRWLKFEFIIYLISCNFSSPVHGCFSQTGSTLLVSCVFGQAAAFVFL